METEDRGCYCDHMRETEEGRRILKEEGVPDGFCGWCDGVEGYDIECDQPGHVRGYPGPVPCTGCWCDECYQLESDYFDEVIEEEAKASARRSFMLYFVLAGLPFVLVFGYITLAHFMGWGW